MTRASLTITKEYAVALDAKLIEERIREVMLRAAGLPTTVADDVAFHMTDWLDDLARFMRFCDAPSQWQDEEIEDMLLAFLVHVPNHVAAAAKLLTGLPVTDVFGVGAVDNESND
jgi:hypothetical protein